MSQVIGRVIREAVAGDDAYNASHVLSHQLCRSSMTETDEAVLADIVESSGLGRGTMPTNLLNDLMASVRISEAQLILLLGQNARTR